MLRHRCQLFWVLGIKAKSVTRVPQAHCAYPEKPGKLRALLLLLPGLGELLLDVHHV